MYQYEIVPTSRRTSRGADFVDVEVRHGEAQYLVTVIKYIPEIVAQDIITLNERRTPDDTRTRTPLDTRT